MTGLRETNDQVSTVEKETLRRTNSDIQQLGFTILLNPGWYNYHKPMAVKNDFVGWKILAHNPHKYPEVAGKGFSVNAGTEAFISLRAQASHYLLTDDGFWVD